jgi:hypothetical protein
LWLVFGVRTSGTLRAAGIGRRGACLLGDARR